MPGAGAGIGDGGNMPNAVEGFRLSPRRPRLEPLYDAHVRFTNYCVKILDGAVGFYTQEEYAAALRMQDAREAELKRIWDNEPSLRGGK